jgi:hypothetical protein
VEALMGFQFNHVGGGTKTRRPITLHMKYNSGCVQPTCYLMLEDVGEQEVSLEELQARALQLSRSCSPCMVDGVPAPQWRLRQLERLCMALSAAAARAGTGAFT